MKIEHPKETKQPTHIQSPPNIIYVFHIDDDAEITCEIGGVNVDMLIDSGSKNNIINDKTWEYLKSNAVVALNQQEGSDQVFRAYRAIESLEVLGSFEASITIGPVNQSAKFYVIKNGTRNLLGKETAIKLNVLKLGVSTNSVDTEPEIFPKFKGIQLNIAIDKSVTPIC